MCIHEFHKNTRWLSCITWTPVYVHWPICTFIYSKALSGLALSWEKMEQSSVTFTMFGEASLHIDKSLLDLLTKIFHVPPSPQPPVPSPSTRFRCYWQHHFTSIALGKVGQRQWEKVRWWHSLFRAIGLSIPMSRGWSFSFLQQVAKLCRKMIDVHFPVDSLGSALSSALEEELIPSRACFTRSPGKGRTRCSFKVELFCSVSLFFPLLLMIKRSARPPQTWQPGVRQWHRRQWSQLQDGCYGEP